MISTLPGALGAQEAWEVLAPSERFLGFRLKTLRRFHLIDSHKVRKQVGRHITGWFFNWPPLEFAKCWPVSN